MKQFLEKVLIAEFPRYVAYVSIEAKPTVEG